MGFHRLHRCKLMHNLQSYRKTVISSAAALLCDEEDLEIRLSSDHGPPRVEKYYRALSIKAMAINRAMIVLYSGILL